jgi:hypothetical protein
MIGVKLFAIETDPQKKRTLHAMAGRCIWHPFRKWPRSAVHALSMKCGPLSSPFPHIFQRFGRHPPNSATVPTEKTDAKKSKPHKPKVLARQRNNYERPGFGNALGYAQETRNGPRGLFFNW